MVVITFAIFVANVCKFDKFPPSLPIFINVVANLLILLANKSILEFCFYPVNKLIFSIDLSIDVAAVPTFLNAVANVSELDITCVMFLEKF